MAQTKLEFRHPLFIFFLDNNNTDNLLRTYNVPSTVGCLISNLGQEIIICTLQLRKLKLQESSKLTTKLLKKEIWN